MFKHVSHIGMPSTGNRIKLTARFAYCSNEPHRLCCECYLRPRRRLRSSFNRNFSHSACDNDGILAKNQSEICCACGELSANAKELKQTKGGGERRKCPILANDLNRQLLDTHCSAARLLSAMQNASSFNSSTANNI